MVTVSTMTTLNRIFNPHRHWYCSSRCFGTGEESKGKGKSAGKSKVKGKGKGKGKDYGFTCLYLSVSKRCKKSSQVRSGRCTGLSLR